MKAKITMQSKSLTPEEYIEALPEEKKAAMKELRKVIKKNLPKGFKEVVAFDMINYVVPHSIYPAGYHVNPKMPLGLMSIGPLKNGYAVHHMGIYGNKKLLDWFTAEYAKVSKTKLDMGKSCLRFKSTQPLPLELIGELATKLTPEAWVEMYEKILQQYKVKK